MCYCEVHPCDVTDEWIRDYAKDGSLKGVILSGSHASVYEDTTDKRAAGGVRAGRAGAGHLLRHADHGARSSAARSRAGTSASSALRTCARAAIPSCSKDIADFTTAEGHGMLNVWMSHGDKVTELPPGFKLMASTDSCPIAGMADEDAPFLRRAVPSRSHAHAAGPAILDRFVLEICGARPDWVMRDHIAEAVEAIRKQVGDEEVILGLSGGVDSSVAAALIHRAIGDQLTCVFVDHGLLRLNEGDMVMDMFAEQAGREGDPRRCQRAVPRQAGRRERSRSQAQDHRRRVRRQCSSTRLPSSPARARRAPSGWRRAPSIRT